MWQEMTSQDVITKNNGKVRRSEKSVKLYIIRKVLTRVIQKYKFYQISVIFVKSYNHLSEILAFLPQALTRYK